MRATRWRSWLCLDDRELGAFFEFSEWACDEVVAIAIHDDAPDEFAGSPGSAPDEVADSRCLAILAR